MQACAFDCCASVVDFCNRRAINPLDDDDDDDDDYEGL